MIVLTEKDVTQGAKILKQGEILAFPTETVYGVGVVYDQEAAFAKLAALKKRPPTKPFTLMCSSLKEAYDYTSPGPKAKAVMDRFFPGELTVLVPAKAGLPAWVTLGTAVIGIRVPGSAFARRLIGKVGKPCLVTSANISGEPASRNYDEVAKIFQDELGGLVQGTCESLVPSTIVDLSDESKITLVRPGPLLFKDLEKVWKGES